MEPSTQRSGSATTFDQARAAFERASQQVEPTLREDDFGDATAISTHGSAACKLRGARCRRKTPTAGRGASAASRSRLRTRCTSTPFTGRRMNKHVEKRPFAEPEAAARKLSSVSSSRASQASGKTRQSAEKNPGSRTRGIAKPPGKLGTRPGSASWCGMPRFYFDYRSPAVVIDHEGIDLADLRAVERLARELLGETIICGAGTGPIEVEARDEFGPILRMTATIEVKRRTEHGGRT